MRTTDELVDLVLERAKRRERRQETRALAALSAASVTLFAGLVSLCGALGGGHYGGVPGPYGATLLFENAGGYVLVGVIAFVSAAAITVLCVQHREKRKKARSKDEKGEKGT